VGPQLAHLQASHPEVHWVGHLPPQDLAALYASADVLVFPSRLETFGQVMLEAMSCGTPVAAHPEHGPMDILAKGQGGAVAPNLREAVLRALAIPRHHARLRALDFNWVQSAQQFVRHLVQIKKLEIQYRKALDANFCHKSAQAGKLLSPIRHKTAK